MEQCEENSQENDDVIIEKEISKLIEEQRLFTESIYACLPVGIEIYDAHGVLRSINFRERGGIPYGRKQEKSGDGHESG